STTPMALQEQDFVGYQSLLNYRSPESIARFIREALPEFAFTGANDLPGLGVQVTPYQESSEQPKLVGRLVGQRLKQRFQPQDIAILSCRGVGSTALKDCARVGNHTLRRFTNTYDLLGNQIYSDGQILFDTVRRFKGQQAAAVILVDVDPRETDLQRELQVLFCGLTRATVHLDVVCAESNPVVQERILPLA
ncbi:ATP-binding domain-containing protein, partial [Thiorhodovibrio winogradskyi]|uniref:ATP-binding domain-containing protein n=1 Tax=Thiorhodovibrio winogradskyi TaxID=77007 RepID=UPI0019120159